MQKLELKEGFKERMKAILGKDYEKFMDSLEGEPLRSLRVNELKISPAELRKRLEGRGWKISQPFPSHPEIMTVDSPLEPGEMGRTLEHLLGYYYVQEISSMLPVIALSPKPGEAVLDLCASPGSKTTQIAAKMENSGTLAANEVDLGRMKILSSNLERCGVSNAIVTRKDGSAVCSAFRERGILFDKILVDAPCSGEGTLRNNPKTARMWNLNGIKRMSSVQRRLLSSAIGALKPGGEIVYSTCTYAPEEDEEVVNFILENFKGEIRAEKISLPVKSRAGISSWNGEDYSENIKYSCRIYPMDNNTEGFFLAKFRKVKSG